MRGATQSATKYETQDQFQSTLPMRGATIVCLLLWICLMISIHTPHAGSDFAGKIFYSTLVLFQSTLPMRGATYVRHCNFIHRRYFNPHSPCGERLYYDTVLPVSFDFNPHSPCGERRCCPPPHLDCHTISIHTPHAGSDPKGYIKCIVKIDFNPHSPCGERPRQKIRALHLNQISIHTPHAGSDRGYDKSANDFIYFNPHSPCGERQRTYFLMNF